MLIASDGSISNKTSGRAWIIATDGGEAAKETDKQDNYLHPRFKYRNDYNLCSIIENKYNNTSTVQIEKQLEERKLSERILRIDRRVKDESTSKINNYKIITTDLKTKIQKNQRGLVRHIKI